MGPSKPLSSLFVSLFGVLWIAEKSSRKTPREIGPMRLKLRLNQTVQAHLLQKIK
jgi:hypothetical protein